VRRAGIPVAIVVAAGLAVAAGSARAAVVAGRPPAGTITTVAGGVGGPGPALRVAIDACGLKFVAGALYVGGRGGSLYAPGAAVRRVALRTGRLTTPVAGLTGVCGVTVDAAGNLLLAGTDRVRVMARRTGRFYGLKMTAGHLYTVEGPQGYTFSDVVDVELDHAGNVVVADSGQPPFHPPGPPTSAQVRVLAERNGRFYGQKMTAGHVYTVAGRATQSGPGGGNGDLASRVWLGITVGPVRVDEAGNLVVADNGGGWTAAPSVRVVAVRNGTFYGQRMTAGHLYAIAGDGKIGTSGDGGPGTRAALAFAGAVALDRAGNVVIADCGRVRVVAARTARFYRRKMTAGHIYSIAGTVPDGMFGKCYPLLDLFGNPNDTGDGGPAAGAQLAATAVTVDSDGNIVLANGPLRVRVVAERTGFFYGRTMRAGDIYPVAGDRQIESSGDGLPATRAEFLPGGVTEDHAGDLAIADTNLGDGTGLVRVVPAASGNLFGRKMSKGRIYSVAAYSTIGTTTQGMAADSAGNVLVADEGTNQVRVVAARSGAFYGRKMTAGRIYTIAGDGNSAYSGDGGPATAAGMNPVAVAVDGHGNVLVADGNNRLRMVAARSGTFYGQQMTAGHIYTVAGDGTRGFSGDGGPATAAEFAYLSAVAVDGAGNPVLADSGNNRVRVVAAVSGRFYGQQMTAGDIYTIAGNGIFGHSGDGGPATAAAVEVPVAVATDRAGNVAVVDNYISVIRMIAIRSGTFYGKKMTAGDIYTIAGRGKGLGDGGPATGAVLSRPTDITVGRAGNLLIADYGHDRVRSVSP
jgi:hypothetical protein